MRWNARDYRDLISKRLCWERCVPDWIKKRVLIVVRTYPTPAKSTIEASCTAAISEDNQWIRMFPVPARLMEHDKRFKKWQWIDVSLLKAPSDSRLESYKLNSDFDSL